MPEDKQPGQEAEEKTPLLFSLLFIYLLYYLFQRFIYGTFKPLEFPKAVYNYYTVFSQAAHNLSI